MMGPIERWDEKARLAMVYSLLAAKKSKTVEPLHILAALQKVSPDMLDKKALKAAKLALPRLPDNPLAALQKSVKWKFKVGEGYDYSKPHSEVSQRAFEAAHKASEEYSSEMTGVPHLLLGIFAADRGLRRQLERAGWSEEKIRTLCREYQPTKQDREFAENIRKHMPHSYRSGIGYDLHRLAEGRKLMIGGINVPFEKGSVGHSDGDVLAHALCDALLGAAGLGDIGTHFPDTDAKWKGAASLLFLEHTRELLDERRLRIVHLDAVVICERPKLGPHFPAMRAALAKSLGIAPEQINLKAKTNEGTGDIGRGEAIAAHTIATLEG